MNQLKIEWACRRGMRELDKMIMPFYQKYFYKFNTTEQETFLTLLDYTDPELFRWLMNQEVAPTEALQKMVNLIKENTTAK